MGKAAGSGTELVGCGASGPSVQLVLFGCLSLLLICFSLVSSAGMLFLIESGHPEAKLEVEESKFLKFGEQ